MDVFALSLIVFTSTTERFYCKVALNVNLFAMILWSVFISEWMKFHVAQTS